MTDEVTFIDLACLLKIGQDTTLEKLGSAINASIFDASNIAGGLKQKGLIDFTAYYPGPNTITVTDVGKALLVEAEAKSAEKYDDLDDTILKQLLGGKRSPVEMQNTINLRPKDLALRIYKLNKQGLIIFELKSGNVDIMLTEVGFLKAKTSTNPPSTPQAPKPEAQQAPAQQSPYSPAMNPYGTSGPDLSDQIPIPTGKKSILPYVAILIVIIILALGALYYLNYIQLPKV